LKCVNVRHQRSLITRYETATVGLIRERQTLSMIDLHCHLLPGIDDGAADLTTSLNMARASVAQGVTTVACTPHILPGLYDNSGPEIREMVRRLQNVLAREDISLNLVTGADVHVTPDFVAGLRSGRLLPLADSRYVLVEPPHHTAPPQLEELFFNLLAAGYVPVLTHPERLSWVPSRYEAIKRLAQSGVWMQITAGSLTGRFGRKALYWAERMLDEGHVHLIASDAHDTGRRPPDMAAGRECAAKRLGDEEALNLVDVRPRGVLNDHDPSTLPPPMGVADGQSEPHVENAGRDHEDRAPRRRRRLPAPLRDISQRLRQLFG
jgi:protein-tyrosine phosphatase